MGQATSTEKPQCPTVRVYHYTSIQGLEGIWRDQKIKASAMGGSDATFGEGVYFTMISPDKPHYEIFENNWDGASPHLIQQWFQKKMQEGGIRVALGFDVPEDELERADTDRDVWLYEGDFHIEDYDCEVYDRDAPDPRLVIRRAATI